MFNVNLYKGTSVLQECYEKILNVIQLMQPIRMPY